MHFEYGCVMIRISIEHEISLKTVHKMWTFSSALIACIIYKTARTLLSQPIDIQNDCDITFSKKKTSNTHYNHKQPQIINLILSKYES